MFRYIFRWRRAAVIRLPCALRDRPQMLVATFAVVTSRISTSNECPLWAIGGHSRRTLSAIWLLRLMLGAIFRARAAHIVLLGPVRIAQRTSDSFPDLGCVLQTYLDAHHHCSPRYPGSSGWPMCGRLKLRKRPCTGDDAKIHRCFFPSATRTGNGIARQSDLISNPSLHRWLAQKRCPLRLRTSSSPHSAQMARGRCLW
jgi:hypothetical protein